MPKTLHIKTFGCQMNEYDSERMAEALEAGGYVRTADAADADLVILNTCHIREKAAEKVYSELGRMRLAKERRRREGRDTIIAVAGCVAQAEGEEIIARAPAVDIVVGPQSNVQDGSVLHVSDTHACVLGTRVTVGHRAIVHACEVGDEVLVGMGAILLDGAVIGARSTIAAGALVTKGTVVPEGSLVVGSPARVVRALTLEEQAANARLALKYVEVSRRYRGLQTAGELA